MTELYIFIIAFVVSFIGILIPGMTTSLGVSSMMLLWIPIQTAKSTFQVGAIWASIWGLLVLRKSNKIDTKLLLYLAILSIISWYIGWNILVSIPAYILMKLTGLFMILLLIINFSSKSLGIVNEVASLRRKVIGYVSLFCAYIFYSVFPMWAGVLFQFIYTFFFRVTHIEWRYLTTLLSIPFVSSFMIPVFLSGIANIQYIIIYIVWSFIWWYLWAHSGLKLWNTILKKILMVWLFCLGMYFLFFAKV